jgi:tetratricopeptide (TPR) repeat protein
LKWNFLPSERVEREKRKARGRRRILRNPLARFIQRRTRKTGIMKKGWLSILLLLAAGACQGPTAAVSTDHRTEAEAGYVDQDIRDFSRVIEKKPGYAAAYVHRGMAYIRKGDYDRAIQDFTKAIELDPKAGSTYGKRGAALLEKGMYEEAIRDLTKAIELYPRFAQAYLNRGNIYLHKGNYTQAVRDFTAAIEIHPGYAKAYHGRARAYQAKRLESLAAEDFRQACELGDEEACEAASR